MDKNTIWAIVLSTLVIIASYLILPKFFPGLNPAIGKQAVQTQSVETAEQAEPQELDLSAMEEDAAVFADADGLHAAPGSPNHRAAVAGAAGTPHPL